MRTSPVAPPAERVQARVEPPALEIEAERPHQRFADRALRRHREGAGDRRRRAVARLALAGGADEVRQLGPQGIEHRVDAGAAQAGVVLVEERVVGREAERLALGAADLAGEAQHVLQVGLQDREVARGAGLAPGHLGGRGRLGLRFDEVARDRGSVGMGAAHLAQVRRLPGVERSRAGFGLGQEVGGGGSHQQLVRQAAQGGELLGAARRGARRHQGLGVPAEDAGGVPEGAEAGEEAFERGVGRHGADPVVVVGRATAGGTGCPHEGPRPGSPSRRATGGGGRPAGRRKFRVSALPAAPPCRPRSARAGPSAAAPGASR